MVSSIEMIHKAMMATIGAMIFHRKHIKVVKMKEILFIFLLKILTVHCTKMISNKDRIENHKKSKSVMKMRIKNHNVFLSHQG